MTCPLVLRTPVGGGIHAPEHHSESIEAFLAHVPGLKCVIPSTPERAYGLLLSAIRDPDPVVFLEPTRLYRLAKGPVQDDGRGFALGRAFVEREGSDVTLVSWGGAMWESRAAAARLDAEGTSVELIDAASITPFDEDTVIGSVRRTGRLVIVHEAPCTGGFGAEIAARVAERALEHLLAPIERVTGFDTVMPLPKLERDYLPGVERIVAALRRALEND